MTDKSNTTDAANAASTEAEPLTLLGRDELLGIPDRKYKIVHVRAWDGRPVRIRSLSAKEREEYEQSITSQVGDGQSRTNIVGARAKEFRFARYIEDWRLKIERIGELNYPAAARGVYGTLQVSVSIRADGSLDGVEISRPSGKKVLDDAAIRIVRPAVTHPITASSTCVRK